MGFGSFGGSALRGVCEKAPGGGSKGIRGSGEEGLTGARRHGGSVWGRAGREEGGRAGGARFPEHALWVPRPASPHHGGWVSGKARGRDSAEVRRPPEWGVGGMGSPFSPCLPEAVPQGLMAFCLSPVPVADVSDLSHFLSLLHRPHTGVIQAARQLLRGERAPLRQRLLADLLHTVSGNVTAETRAEDPPWFEGAAWARGCSGLGLGASSAPGPPGQTRVRSLPSEGSQLARPRRLVSGGRGPWGPAHGSPRTAQWR